MPKLARYKIKSAGLRISFIMGLSHSSDSKEESEDCHTPVKNQRVQKLADPRSPTDDVARTPMQRTLAEGDSEFEDPRSPTTKIARTPIPDDSDPRSPSGGRGTGPFVFPDSSDPRSPNKDILRTPICKDAPIDPTMATITVHQPDQNRAGESSGNNNMASNDKVPETLSTDNTEASAPQSQTETDESISPAGDASDKCESGQVQESENTPEYEMKLSELMENQRIAAGEADGEEGSSAAVLSNREFVFLTELPPSPAQEDPAPMAPKLSTSSNANTKADAKANVKKPSSHHHSLKEKCRIVSASSAAFTAQRSPLSTRNLLQDSPDPALRPRTAHNNKMGVALQKASIRRRLMVDDDEAGFSPAGGNEARMVGRYMPVMDKENY